MNEMRKWNTGTWEVTSSGQGRWRKKGEISKSVKQLAELFGVELTGKVDSEKYWRLYLTQRHKTQLELRAASCSRPLRASSIITAIKVCSACGMDVTALEAQLSLVVSEANKDPNPPSNVAEMLAKETHAAVTVEDYCRDPDAHDGPIIDPRIADVAAKLDVDEDDVIKQAILADILVKQEKIRHPISKEIADYLARDTDAKGKIHYGKRTALHLLQAVTGNISIDSITVDHWRTFVDKVQATYPNKRTAYNHWKLAYSFLRGCQIDHNLSWGWLDNRKNHLTMPSGNKVQWSFEQVRLALANATGIDRTSLLCGLNFGWYREDISSFQLADFDGTRVNKARQKLHADKDAMVCSHLAWKETQVAFQYGLSARQITRHWTDFAKQYQLPVHKALRKTVSQWIQDYVGEEEARLYRGERAAGNHGKFYIKLTEPQKAKLDSALEMVHGILFENRFPENFAG